MKILDPKEKAYNGPIFDQIKILGNNNRGRTGEQRKINVESLMNQHLVTNEKQIFTKNILTNTSNNMLAKQISNKILLGDHQKLDPKQKTAQNIQSIDHTVFNQLYNK